MGHYGQAQTPGQGQDTEHSPAAMSLLSAMSSESSSKSNVTAIIRVVGVQSSRSSSKSNVTAIIEVISENAFWALLGLCPTLPIFLKLPKLSPSRTGHNGQSRTPGQGQDTEQNYQGNKASLLKS